MSRSRDPERVITYVDGFNFYYGLMEENLGQFRWLDYQVLSGFLLKNNQTLMAVKYFTAKIKGKDRAKVGRQRLYLEALATRTQLEIIYGRFVKDNRHCFNCGHRWPNWEEKMTDVNMAAEITADAHENEFDTALVVSGDSDLAHAVDQVQKRTGKKVVAAFPPKRASYDLKLVADAAFSINRTYIAKSQLENPVVGPSGDLHRPTEWN